VAEHSELAERLRRRLAMGECPKLTVKPGMFTRGGQAGYVVGVYGDGVGLNFASGALGGHGELWRWHELEIGPGGAACE
jgi:hypothetical protein